MKLQFLQSTVLDVVISFDEKDEIVESSPETFNEGEVVDVDLLEESESEILVQFGDGSVAEVLKDYYKVVPELDTTPPREVLQDLVAAENEATSAGDEEDDGILTPEERAQLAEELAASKQTQHQQPEQ